MALPDFFANLARPIRKLASAAKSFTQTWNRSSANQVLSVPAYRDHLSDLLTTRQASDSNTLLQQLFKHDTDVSAAVDSYLTLADTPMSVLVKSVEGEIDQAATLEVHKILMALTNPTDYSVGFSHKPNLAMLCQELRYMLLLRGAIGTELVFGKQLVPERVQQFDMISIEWFERAAGVFTPQQKAKTTGDIIDLNLPNIFISYHRRDPTTPYPTSDFVSAINTIAARTQVINDLYRIMRVTGFPRIAVEVMEDVIIANAPASVKDDPEAMRQWLRDRLAEIQTQFGGLRADQPMIHYSSSKPSMLNEKNPGAGIKIAEVIDTLNAQNQAGLKTMATIIGRAKSGTNTSTVEARIAALNADQLNKPLSQLLSRLLTFALNVYGIAGLVEVAFEPAEMRPHLELEPQRVMKASRLKEDLSLGLITDDEYHWWMYGRFAPSGAPKLSGTGFATKGTKVDTENISPNSDPLGRSIAPEGGESARSNEVK